jgi:hypothetical protein
MQKLTIILFALVMLACARTRSADRTRLTWLQRFEGWQKVLGAVAIILALLIILNPEFFALGIIGDTAFFDMLALALALQMHTFVARAIRLCITVTSRSARALGIPSPGFRYLLAVSRHTLRRLAFPFQKAADQSFSCA